MPWTAKDAKKKTKKANTPRKQEIWRDIANRMLTSSGDEGRSIREANAVVGGTTRRKRRRP